MNYNDLIPELTVTDINKSKEFYVDILGFKIEYERIEEKFLFLSYGNIQIMLEQGSPEKIQSMSYPFGQGINFTFGVDNLDEIYHRVRNAEYPINTELEIRHFRVDNKIVSPKEFSVLDPDGYFIRLSD